MALSPYHMAQGEEQLGPVVAVNDSDFTGDTVPVLGPSTSTLTIPVVTDSATRRSGFSNPVTETIRIPGLVRRLVLYVK